MSAPRVRLLFGVHAHQPAGNFPDVVRHAHERCYKPFLETMERFPEFHFAMHVSGWLLGFLAREYPRDVERLAGMTARGQVEIFIGGDTEPILAAIPEPDRRGQIAAMRRRVESLLPARPSGAWLAERVWESSIVQALVAENVRYVPVDDYHFLCAGIAGESLDGYYSTEENGKRLDLFPISEALRYKFPFASVSDALQYLESRPAGGAAIYFDDIEKFGIWPETHDWVYGARWLEQFLEGVLASSVVQPMRYDAFHRQHRTKGIVYPPAVSYFEMSEWTLPPSGAGRFSSLTERAKHEGTFDRDKAFLRGGHWRNYFSRYPESNWMHKRMESASRRFHSLPAAARTDAMRTDLHLSQANDAYWHGLFGGLYLPHLRRQVYGSLARLEVAVQSRKPRPAAEFADVDYDGHEEALLWRPEMFGAVRPADGAGLCELTDYRLAHNFADTLARREEQYYWKIRDGRYAVGGSQSGLGVASIHDRVAFRTHVSEADLAVDRHPRLMLMDFLVEGGDPHAERHLLRYRTRRPAAPATPAVDLNAAHGALRVAKRVILEGDGPRARYELSADQDAGCALVVESSIAMPSCDGPGGHYEIEGEAAGGFADRIGRDGCSRVRLDDSELGGSITMRLSDPAEIVLEPLVTVSQSEAGFEKIMQAATVTVIWAVALRAGEMCRYEIALHVEPPE